MRLAFRAFFAAVLAWPGVLAAQSSQLDSGTALADLDDPAISRRIMLGVARPAETLGAQAVLYGPVQSPPGTSPGAAVIGNIIGTLLVKSIEQSRERELAEFSAGLARALSDIDLARELADQIRLEMERTGHLRGASLEEVKDASDLEQPGLLVRISERDIFTLDVRCSFGRNMTSLYLLTGARLWRKNEFRPVYTARLRYISKSLADQAQARQRWIAEDGELLKRALREGLAETARLFVAETAVRASGAALPLNTVQAPWIAAHMENTSVPEVHVLAETEDRILGKVRAPAEETISLPRETAATFE